MNFIDRLTEQERSTAEAEKIRLAKLEAKELIRNQAEQQRIRQSRAIAQAVYSDSGINNLLKQLVIYLKRPTVPYNVFTNVDGLGETTVQYKGRGAEGLPKDSPGLEQQYPYSVVKAVHWDEVISGLYQEVHTYNYLAVVANPNGSIEFLGEPNDRWDSRVGGSSTFSLMEWRFPRKLAVFDYALEKAFRNPRIHTFKTPVPVSRIAGGF